MIEPVLPSEPLPDRDDAPAAPPVGGELPETPILGLESSDTRRFGRSGAPVGPGLWESLLWIAGFFAIEIIGSLIWGAGIAGYRLLTTGAAPTNPADFEASLGAVMPWMIGSLKLVEVIVAVVAIRLRFGPQAFRVTGFRSVPALHGAILGFAVVPTAFLSGQSYALFQGYWTQVTDLAPWLKVFDDMSSIEAVQQMAETTPLAVLVLIIAVLPALNEEFVFRAAIGRGLLARYGLIAGISLTSMLFAAVHLSPIHAAALLPLAVLMHVGYLSSGSIWAPVGVHFVNNTLSVALMKLATVAPEVGGVTMDVTESQFSPILFTASVACVAATVWLLMKVRVRWRLPDGTAWRPEYVGVEPPPGRAEATAIIPTPPTLSLAVTAACYALFPIALITSVWLHQM